MNLNGKTVLIIEDEATNYMLLKEYLEPSGANVIWAETGKDGLSLFDQEKPDIILLDMRLPDISGNEITRIIRSKNDKIPIIAQTAFAMQDDRKRFLESGCSDYLSKPIAEDVFLNTISKYF
jgi:CheY-like chemotaxis protein